MSRLTRRAEVDGVKAVWYGDREVFLEGETGYAEADKLAHYEDLEEQGRLIEIVKCRDCEHYNTDGCSEGCGWCEKLNIGSFDDAYCDKASLAELKGTEE